VLHKWHNDDIYWRCERTNVWLGEGRITPSDLIAFWLLRQQVLTPLERDVQEHGIESFSEGWNEETFHERLGIVARHCDKMGRLLHRMLCSKDVQTGRQLARFRRSKPPSDYCAPYRNTECGRSMMRLFYKAAQQLLINRRQDVKSWASITHSCTSAYVDNWQEPYRRLQKRQRLRTKRNQCEIRSYKVFRPLVSGDFHTLRT
jgi:hypothetical protein